MASLRIKLFFLLLLPTLALGLSLRLPEIDQRPLHADEAVHAVKFNQLLAGTYCYDPHEYHGPTLYYLTLPIYALAGVEKWADLTPTHFRLVTVGCGLLLILFTALTTGAPGWGNALAALFTAISPAMVFYSRYYIQEIPLLLFTLVLLVALIRFRHTGNLRWTITAGLAAGIMYATKETSVLIFFALGMAMLLVGSWQRITGQPQTRGQWIKLWPALPFGLVTAAVLLSGFGDNWSGPLDSLNAFSDYFKRGSGGEARHNYPWFFYFERLLCFSREGGPWFTEGMILLLAMVGWLFAIAGKGIGQLNIWTGRLLAIYAFILTAIYCLIPYKTPWCMLGFYHSLILLAGFGAIAIIRLLPGKSAAIFILLLTGGALHLVDQTILVTGRMNSHRGNPYNYAGTSRDAVRLARRIEELTALHPLGNETPVQIAFPDHYYWPLPWYLRRLKQVGYYGQIPAHASAPLVITPHADPTPLKGTRHFSSFGLRSGVILSLAVNQTLWDSFIANQSSSVKINHRAMNTGFQLSICGVKATYAKQAGREASELLDRLDRKLSRFNPNGGLARISTMKAGAKLKLSRELFHCLQLAQEFHLLTWGAFDPAAPARAKSGNQQLRLNFLRLQAGDCSLTAIKPKQQMDLGGIGKGYALDRIKDLFQQWEIKSALLHGGHSSVLALAPPPGKSGWPLTIPDPQNPTKVLLKLQLCNQALGASGITIKGAHIISPRTGKPVKDRLAAWALAPTATAADALATAFMVMHPRRVKRFCAQHPRFSALLVNKEKIYKYGDWPEATAKD